MSLQGAGERKAAPNQPAHGRPPLDGEQVERVYHFDNCFREEAAFFGGIRLYQIGETCLEKGCLRRTVNGAMKSAISSPAKVHSEPMTGCIPFGQTTSI